MTAFSLTDPTGSESAATIDDEIRSVRVDVKTKINEMLGVDISVTDPARATKIVIPAGGLTVRNSADSATVATFTNSGVSFPIGSGGSTLPYDQEELASDTALTSSYADMATMTLAAGTWLVLAQVTVGGTFTGGTVDVRVWNGASNIALAQNMYSGNSNMMEVISCMGVAVLGGSTTIYLQAKDPASVTTVKGGGATSPYTRLIAVGIA